MISRLASIILLIFLSAFTINTVHAEKISVLFIGNSFSYANNMPYMLSQIANSLGDEVQVDLSAPGGATLMNHLYDSSTLAKLQSRNWTYVVLQEQSQAPAFPLAQFNAQVLEPAIRLNKLIHDASPATKIVFFQTWAMKNGDPMNCHVVPQTCDYIGMQELLNSRYAQLAQKSQAIIAPVGSAWWQVRYEHPEIQLYTEDGKHPSEAGSYLAACVFYVTLFGKPVTGASPLNLSDDIAQILQSTAQKITGHK